MLFEPPIGEKAAVPRQDLGLRQRSCVAVLVRIPEEKLAWLERRTRTGDQFATEALDRRFRHAIAVAEMIVRVVERRGRLEIERRERFNPGELCRVLLVLANAALSFGDVAGKEDHDRVEVRAGKAAHPVIGMIGPGIAEDRGARRHPLTKLFGKRRQTCVIDAERTQAVPGEGDGDPARINRSSIFDRAAATDTVDDAGQPGSSLIRRPEAEEPVARRQGTRPNHQKMLDVVQFQHRGIHSCLGAFTASGRASTKTPASVRAPS